MKFIEGTWLIVWICGDFIEFLLLLYIIWLLDDWERWGKSWALIGKQVGKISLPCLL